jgi:hypothetical protein
MDGKGKITLRNDTVLVEGTSGGEEMKQTWPLDAALEMVAELMSQMAERDGRQANVVAFQRKGTG